jgi:hypothetical protein
MPDFPEPKSKETPINTELGLGEEKMEEKEAMEEMEVKKEKEETGEFEPKVQPTKIEETQIVTQTVVPKAAVQTDPMAEKIESILEEDLTDLYLSLPIDKQKEFKAKGDEVLTKIGLLLKKTKINAKKIFQLIRDWLKIIPGVNRFFLEQEAKIKTDKILRL